MVHVCEKPGERTPAREVPQSFRSALTPDLARHLGRRLDSRLRSTALGNKLEAKRSSRSGHILDLPVSERVTFFTLGYGDIAPVLPIGRIIVVMEAGNGLGLFAIVISYLPVLYQAFSRREASISLLDARAGSPSSAVELLRRHRAEDSFADLNRLLSEWERWSAELLESHLSYPVLCYFRSQHDNQSWLRALTTVLDTCALVMVGVEGAPVWQARMTFAMARHAVVDIAQVFRTAPTTADSCKGRLPPEELVRMRMILAENGIRLPVSEDIERRLVELRMMYEPYVYALSEWLLMPLPPWILPADAIDNWKTSAWGRIQ